MTTVLKLGGSVITEKDRPETIDGEALDGAVDAIAQCTDDLLLVHGGGSFGHHYADRHGVDTSRATTDSGAIMEIHRAMTTLNRFVLDRLHVRNVPGLPVHPLSLASRDRSGELRLPTAGIETMLESAFVPVLHGDVIPHEGSGATILSGDEIAVALGNAIGADRVGLCSTVPGVLDGDGNVIDGVGNYDAVADLLGESATTDVTGGMAGKVELLLDLEEAAFVFDLDDLEAFLTGGSPGTRIG